MKERRMKSAESGFTLLEIVVAIVLLGILTTIAVFSFEGSKSRGQLLVSGMDEYGNALIRMKADTACYPKTLNALFVKTAASSSSCDISLVEQWNGPYTKDARSDGNGDILLDQLCPRHRPEHRVNRGRQRVAVARLRRRGTERNTYSGADRLQRF